MGKIIVSKYYRAELLLNNYCNSKDSEITVDAGIIGLSDEATKQITHYISRAFIAGYKAAYDDVKNGLTTIE